MISVYVGFSRIFLLGILIFKGLNARRLYKSLRVKGLSALTLDTEIKHQNSQARVNKKYIKLTRMTENRIYIKEIS
jgi:hypothetical protein